jgi:hypothetical protein
VVELLEEVQRPMPALRRAAGVTRRRLVVAQSGQHVGFLVPMAELAPQRM